MTISQIDPTVGFVTDTDVWVAELLAVLTQAIAASLDHTPETIPEYIEAEAIYQGKDFKLRIDFSEALSDHERV